MACVWDRRGAYRVVVGGSGVKKLYGRPRCRWKSTIKMNLREAVGGSIGWIDLAQDRKKVTCFCECGNEPLGSIKCGEFVDWMRNS
jgi:hypothetical protein